MSFLQPWMLWALPLVLLPILIHLINRYRHNSVPWGAMMFLVSAKRMNQGMARIRYVLIMLLRMLAIAVLIFAVGRPLATGGLAGLGGMPDATIVLLDRSASMETKDLQTGQSRRSTALVKLADLLETRGYGNELLLLDSASDEVHRLAAPGDLLDLPATQPTATSADVPGMLQRALDHLEQNEAGRADVWICSDLRENDWDPTSGRWAAIRAQAAAMSAVSCRLLAYGDVAADNLAIRVTNVRRQQRGDDAELLLDVSVSSNAIPGSGVPVRRVPIEFQIQDVASVLPVDVDANGIEVIGHSIPIDGQLVEGWGSVSISGDSNALDNRFYFAFADHPQSRATVVAEDARVGRAIRRALRIPSESGRQHEVDLLTLEQAAEIDWQRIGLLVWQGPLPTGSTADQLAEFVDAGRAVLFLPPERPDDAALFGLRWHSWEKLAGQERTLSSWRADTDLLQNVGSGDALPLDDVRVYSCCLLDQTGDSGPFVLAEVGDGITLLARADGIRGAAWFLTTQPVGPYSTLERDGIAFYVMLQRALVRGMAALSGAQQRDASAEVAEDCASLDVVTSQKPGVGVSERGLQAGVYQGAGVLLAVNRSAQEDAAPPLPDATVDALFEGVSYRRIDDALGDDSSLASEIWRAFLFAMLIALVLEAVLCLPARERPRGMGRERMSPVPGGAS